MSTRAVPRFFISQTSAGVWLRIWPRRNRIDDIHKDEFSNCCNVACSQIHPIRLVVLPEGRSQGRHWVDGQRYHLPSRHAVRTLEYFPPWVLYVDCIRFSHGVHYVQGGSPLRWRDINLPTRLQTWRTTMTEWPTRVWERAGWLTGLSPRG